MNLSACTLIATILLGSMLDAMEREARQREREGAWLTPTSPW